MIQKDRFFRFSTRVFYLVGKPGAFLLALASIVTWGIFGPVFSFSSAWQLSVNTGTTIITFLMVFIIQSSQNRSDTALQLKLDEIIRVLDPASNFLIDIEDATEEEIRHLQKEYKRLREQRHDHYS